MFHIITSFAVREDFDLEPTLKAIKCHCNIKTVACIHILSETQKSVVEKSTSFLNHPKIVFIPTPHRPSFSDIFNYCNDLKLEKDSVVAVMNSDVSFATEFDIEKSIHVLDVARTYGYFAILALTRRDYVDGVYILQLYDITELPNNMSADCWVFRPPLKIRDMTYFSLGDMNCDMFIAYDLSKAGHLLLNPCLDIALNHYEVDLKNIQYYQNQNKKDRASSLQGWHWGKSCNVPYKSYGVPWVKTEWIECGFLPFPFYYQKKRIYLAVQKYQLSDEIIQATLLVTEVIAKIYHCDLVILTEDIMNVERKIVEQIGLVTNHVYFFSVRSINEVLNRLVSETHWFSDSCAVISRFDFLTKELIQCFHSVILDLRNVDLSSSVFVPIGHENLQCFAENRYSTLKNSQEVVFSENFIDSSSCTLISSIYHADVFIEGFKRNITALHGYERMSHIILFSVLSELEQSLLMKWHNDNQNLILCWFKTDPGLYECWNVGIKLAQTEYISNANVDDLRDQEHVRLLVENLRSNPNTVVACSALVPFYEYVDDVKKIDSSHPWYADQAGVFGFDNLARLKQNDSGNWTLVPHNLPHCMPIWRKALHEKHGYFDEKRFGTFADWAFWLKVTKAGGNGYLNALPLTYYFVNQTSHNRRGEFLATLHRAVEDEFLADFYFRKNAITTGATIGHKSVEWPRKLFLKGLTQVFGQHRNSFNRLIECLKPLHNEKGGIQFIPFIERYFVWGDEEGEAASTNPYPIQQDWIGILHVPFDAPKWFESSVSPETIFSTDLWKASLPHCRGIICLTEDLRRDLKYWYPQLPSMMVKFTTELNVLVFNWESYVANPCLVQAGDWLRRLQYIYELDVPTHKKYFLKKRYTNEFLRREIEVFGDRRNDSVTVLDFVSNEDYDRLLSTSVVVCWLYGAAANNIVLECIARRTPIIINPLPSVVEYLGIEYPLYITDRDDGKTVISDSSRIRAAYDYLVERNDLREDISYSSFLCNIASSEFYKNL